MTAKSMTHQEILDIFPKEYNVTINGMVLSIYSPTYIGIILDDTVIIENKKDWIDIKTKGSSMTFFKSSCPNSHITIH